MVRQSLIGATFVIAVIGSLSANAQDFRVETDVFSGREKEPIAEYLTLFSGNTIYDFLLTEPRQTTVFDMARNRFILLDPERSVKTELTTHDLEAFQLGLRDRALERKDPFFQTEFAHSFVKEGKWYVVTGDALEYRARGSSAKFPGAGERYRQFADWYAKLNAMRPGNLPPYARLDLNRVLAEKDLIPDEIQRTVSMGQLARKEEIRTQHLITWVLSVQDQKQISKAGDQIAEFKSVTFEEFTTVAKKK